MKLFGFLGLALFAAAGTANAQDGDWRSVGGTGTASVAIDFSSISLDGTKRIFQITVAFDVLSNDGVDYLVGTQTLDCAARTIQTLQTISYTLDGVMVATSQTVEPASRIEPGAMAETYARAVCDGVWERTSGFSDPLQFIVASRQEFGAQPEQRQISRDTQ